LDKAESKRIAKAFMPAARRIVNRIDPLDLVSMGATKDEYDALVAEAARSLEAGATDLEVRLAQFVRRHYQVAPDTAKVTRLATELRVAWKSVR
jgi:hypothetical protein